MISVREALDVVGQAVSIKELAHQRHESFPLSLRDFVGGRKIKHIFVLMLENRSFDHMLGFSGIEGTDAVTGARTTIDGLTGIESNSYEGRTYTVSRGAADRMDPGPGHSFTNVLEQLCGEDARYPSGGPYPNIKGSNETGYASSYAKRKDDEDRLVGTEAAGNVMKCFTPDQLPVLNTLASEFVVCDHWFSSMPGPTEPNRMFMYAETSGKFDNGLKIPEEYLDAVGRPGGGIEFRHGTVFGLLEQAGVKYRIYAGDDFPTASWLDGISVLFDIREFEDFAEDLKDPSFDAGYVHIEPDYDALFGFGGGNSQHPSGRGSVAAGERLIKAVYEVIRNSPVWEKSLLIITWDEHGGFYDHVVPPSAQGTGERGRENGFTFEQLGPRVPAVVVSPLISRNLIDHRVYDHTAIPATLRRVFGLRSLEGRNGISGGVGYLAGPVARTDAPTRLPGAAMAALAALAPKTAPPRPAARVSEDPEGMAPSTLNSALAQHLEVTPAEQHAAIRARVKLIRTHADAFTYLEEVKQLVRAKRIEAGRVRA